MTVTWEKQEHCSYCLEKSREPEYQATIKIADGADGPPLPKQPRRPFSA
jgi:hypothetical protein